MLAVKRQPAPAADDRHPAVEIAPPAPSAKGAVLADDADSIHSLKAELAFIHEAIARNKRDLGKLIGDGKERRFARASDELGAAIDNMQTATETILKLAETADDGAKALGASLKDDYKRSLAQDIQDQIVKIYEACNFQDLAGQRIGKVMAVLSEVENQIAAMLARNTGVAAATQPLVAAPARANHLINGPKLAGDGGHATQHEIDRMFG